MYPDDPLTASKERILPVFFFNHDKNGYGIRNRQGSVIAKKNRHAPFENFFIRTNRIAKDHVSSRNRKLFCHFILFYKRFDKVHECLHGLVVILQDAVQTVYIKSSVLMNEDIPEPGKS